MKKKDLITWLEDVPEDAEVLIAPGLGEGTPVTVDWATNVREFDVTEPFYYYAGVTSWDVAFLSVSPYDPDYNAVWLEL